jgi:hypothetical protein
MAWTRSGYSILVGWVEPLRNPSLRGTHDESSPQFRSGRLPVLHRQSRRAQVTASRRSRRLLASRIRYARARYPFTIEAIVVLPDHLHSIWSLPNNDADYRYVAFGEK